MDCDNSSEITLLTNSLKEINLRDVVCDISSEITQLVNLLKEIDWHDVDCDTSNEISQLTGLLEEIDLRDESCDTSNVWRPWIRQIVVYVAFGDPQIAKPMYT